MNTMSHKYIIMINTISRKYGTKSTHGLTTTEFVNVFVHYGSP